MTPDQLTLLGHYMERTVAHADATPFLDALARHSDPPTSHAAAASLGDGVWPEVLRAFRTWGPMSDDQLVARLAGMYGPTVRSCRSRLKNEGWIVATAETRPSMRGRQQIVWALAPEYRPTDVVTDNQGRVL